MCAREQGVLLRHCLEQGLRKSALPKRLGVSRRTIYHSIETDQLNRELDDEAVRYGPLRVARQFDPFYELITVRLNESPKLTAMRLFDEIRAAGYVGGYTQVKEYVTARCVRHPRRDEPRYLRLSGRPRSQGRRAQCPER